MQMQNFCTSQNTTSCGDCYTPLDSTAGKRLATFLKQLGTQVVNGANFASKPQTFAKSLRFKHVPSLRMETKKMKKVIVLLLLTAVIPAAFSQEEETLVGGEIESGGFGGPVVKITQVNSESGVLAGGRGGWIINHKFIVGGGGYGLSTNHKSPNYSSETPYYIEMGYGGLELEYVVGSNKVVHYSLQALIGAGGVNFRIKDGGSVDGENDSFFVVEPGANLELNVAKSLRISAGASYRHIVGADYRGLGNSDLSGLAANVVLKFGRF